MNACFADEPYVTVTGRVTDRQVKEDYCSYRIAGASFVCGDESFTHKTLLVYTDAEEAQIPLGSTVAVTGTIASYSHASNEGAFDSYSYYRSLSVSGKISSTSITILRESRLPMREGLRSLRDALQAVYVRELDSGEAGILSAMVLGDKTLLEQDVKAMYQDMGVSHILAISGLHISVLGMGLYRFLRKRLCLPYAVCCMTSGILLFFFGVMSGFSVSTQRAFISFAFYLGAAYTGRTYAAFRAVVLSAVCILVRNPLALTQTGFLLSYSAVLSILCFAPLLKDLLPSALKGMAGGIAVWIGMLPVTARFFYQIPLFSILLNMVILPLCTPLLALSLLGGFAGLVWPAAGRILLMIPHGILCLFDLQMGILDGAAMASYICGQPAFLSVLLFYAVFIPCGLLRLFMQPAQDWLQDMEETARPGLLSRAAHGLRVLLRRQKGWNRLHTRWVPALLTAALLAADAGILLRQEPQEFAVAMLDVGQGDGICITSSDGSCVMIDGGSSSDDAVGTYQILPFLKCNAIRSVDIWLVSHTDADHVSGILEVLEYGYAVDAIAFSNLPKEDENYEALCTAAAENGTRILYVRNGSTIRTADYTMTCLYPDETDASDDSNDLSQVWQLTSDGLSMLFTGDLGSEQEALLIERGLLDDVDILKVGHHGSNYSTSEEFLAVLHPKAALISVGENNLYGHPGSETLARLSDQAVSTYTTMDCGQLTVTVADGQITIRGFLMQE